MDTTMLTKLEEVQYKKRPDLRVGDTVKLHLKVQEAGRERVQIFEGVVIAIKGSGINKNIVVRKISYGIGVEKIVPLHAENLEKIEVVKRGTVRRSKLYYLRGRIGKKALKVGLTKDLYLTDEDQEKIIEESMDEVVAEKEGEEVKETEEKVESKE